MAPKAGTIRNCIATPRTCPSGRICRIGQKGGLPTALTTKGKIFRRCCLRPGSRLAAHGLLSGTTARGKWCGQPLWREGGAEPLLKRRRVDVRNGVGRSTAAYRWAIPETGQSGSGLISVVPITCRGVKSAVHCGAGKGAFLPPKNDLTGHWLILLLSPRRAPSLAREHECSSHAYSKRF